LVEADPTANLFTRPADQMPWPWKIRWIEQL
jgi:hypothetical protein